MRTNKKRFLLLLCLLLFLVSSLPFATQAKDTDKHAHGVSNHTATTEEIATDLEEETLTEEPGVLPDETADILLQEMTETLPVEEEIPEETEDVTSDSPHTVFQTTTTNDLTLPALSERIINTIRNDGTEVAVDDLNVSFDLSNGEHILSDFQDDFFFRYAEESFVVDNLTFTQQNGKLLSVSIQYATDSDTRQQMRAELSVAVSSLIASVSNISDPATQYRTLTELIWKRYYYNYGDYILHSNDAYGCLVHGNCNEYGAACALQVCLSRLGYQGWYLLANGEVYNTITINGTSYLTSVNACNLSESSQYCLRTASAEAAVYSSRALRSTSYSPVSLFSDNPTCTMDNANSQYFLEQVYAGVNPVQLPETFRWNYRANNFMYFWNLACEYGELGFVIDTVSASVSTTSAKATYTYQDTDVDVSTIRERMQQYRQEREKIVMRAQQLPTAKAQVVFVNNFLMKTATYLTMTDTEHVLHAHDAYGCLFEGVCVCDGYAKAFYDIMRCLGIPCEYLYEPNHRFVRVMLDGMWYIVDVTWNDTNRNQFLLTPTHEASNENAYSANLYVMRPCFSMKSDATLQLKNQIAAGATHIDTSSWDFSLDGLAKAADTAYYTETLKDTYPVEMADVASLSFQTDGDTILAVDVTYKTRTNAEKEAFRQFVTTALGKVSSTMSEQEKVATLATLLQKMQMTRTSGDDIYDVAVYNKGSYLGQTRLLGYLIESLGGRFMITKDSNRWPHLKTVYDGNVRYTSIISVLPNWINASSLEYYSLYYDYPVFDFMNMEQENAYLDDWGGAGSATPQIPTTNNLRTTVTTGGVYIQWDAASVKAPRYFLYREEDNSGEWTQVITQPGTEFYDYQVSGGHSYRYSVVVKNRTGTSEPAVSEPVLFLVSPVMHYTQTYSVSDNKVYTTLSWQEAEGAVTYEVYQMNGIDPVKLDETTGTSLKLRIDNDTMEGVNVIPTQLFTYVVVAKNNDDRSALAISGGASLAIPPSTSVTATADGKSYTLESYKRVWNSTDSVYQEGVPSSAGRPILVRWKKVLGTTSYDLYRINTKNGRIRSLGTIAGLQYRDVASAGQYYYCVVPHIRNNTIPAVLSVE